MRRVLLLEEQHRKSFKQRYPNRSKKCSECDHMAEEEVPFKSMKITLSEEALDLLDYLKKEGSFRSYSMTIEEIIRALYDIVVKLTITEKMAADKGEFPIPDDEKLEIARDIAIRLARFRTPPEIPKKY